jgi:hypothetical protein
MFPKVMAWVAIWKKYSYSYTFHRSECQNQPRLLYRACFGKSSVWACQKFAQSLKVKCTQKWIKDNLPGFFSTNDWPVSSLDHNPLDHFPWEYTLAKLGYTKQMTLTKFKTRLTKNRDAMPQQLTDLN